jgi:uracil-DNA glycosylase
MPRKAGAKDTIQTVNDMKQCNLTVSNCNYCDIMAQDYASIPKVVIILLGRIAAARLYNSCERLASIRFSFEVSLCYTPEE